MSYEGYRELLCVTGHYSAYDAYDDASPVCGVCGQAFRYMHGVDQTNGHDASDPACCNAPVVELGFDDIWREDHYGNRFAMKVKRLAPAR
jgi:hypothetical protein